MPSLHIIFSTALLTHASLLFDRKRCKVCKVHKELRELKVRPEQVRRFKIIHWVVLARHSEMVTGLNEVVTTLACTMIMIAEVVI